jgi:hypothetical protein
MSGTAHPLLGARERRLLVVDLELAHSRAPVFDAKTLR